MEWTTILICLAIGIGVAFIVTAVMKGQLKSVHSKSSAADYVRPESMVLTLREDDFLYTRVTRVPKPKNKDD